MVLYPAIAGRIFTSNSSAMRCLFITILLALSISSYGQQGMPDMTQTDITTLADFDGAKVSFMGFHLGMSKKEVIEKLRTIPQWKWKFDAFNTRSESPVSKEQMRIYVRLKDGVGADDPEVMYLLWEKGSTSLASMVFYKAAIPMLTGNTVKLFTTEALDANAGCRKFLHGEPVVEKDNVGIITYQYRPQHFQLIKMEFMGETQVWFKFIM